MALGQLTNEGDLERWMKDKLEEHGLVRAQSLAGPVPLEKSDPRLARGVENLTIIRGVVNTAGAGTIVEGTGFTITRARSGGI